MSARLLICTDLDRTLIPNGPQPESAGAQAHFATLAARPGVTLTYVSGRHRELVQAAIDEYRLPPPDYAVCDVGTTIYHLREGRSWQRQAAWEADIARDWNGLGRGDLELALTGLDELRLQEASRQNSCKLSYYLPPEFDRERLAPPIESRLDALGVSARLVWSVDDATGTGLLDVLPARASKYHAILALMRDRQFGATETVFCGDSGNDIEVLASSIPGVLVANSSPEVQSLAERLARAEGHANRLYIARGGFKGMNGYYVGGMLEGIAHYYPHTVEWMGFDAAECGA
ncbi:MAG TPA: HAD-IIB family hydrolase [Gammaproteobacteria bacterium]|nr:HAD-IIB family hydrolase [Gammaproteobacteria bacterium]